MKKWINIIYGSLFIAFLLLPFVTMNVKKDQISMIDNEKLPELQGEPDEIYSNLEEYVNKRIGFREESLDIYQKINSEIFGVLEHPYCMYGKEGHAFVSLEEYISDYQHLNLDQAWAEGFAMNLQAISDITNAHGAEFIYMLIPDKKTVYSEYFPDSVNVYGELSRTDQVLSELKKTHINWMYVKDMLVSGKETAKLYNKIYDVEHWNENGAFLVYQALYDNMSQSVSDIASLDINNYELTSKVEPTMKASTFVINEEVPLYVLKESSAIEDTKWVEDNLTLNGLNTKYYSRFVNPSASGKPKLLVYHDSYMFDHEKFFTENFSEVTFIHRDNPFNREIYESNLEKISPDIVIFENAERVFTLWFEM